MQVILIAGAGFALVFVGFLVFLVVQAFRGGSHQPAVESGDWNSAVGGEYDWTKEHKRLWDALVPPQGQADTLQGELIRIVGKLVDEAYRNGNLNWDRDCEKMWRFVAKHLDDAATFTESERKLIREKVDEIIRDKRDPDVSGHGSAYYFVNEKAVDWCRAHPDPIPHAKDPKLRR